MPGYLLHGLSVEPRESYRMRKTDKKIDRALSAVLTEACDTAKGEFEGFSWLTHLVDYGNFPASLSVVCVFDTNEQRLKANKERLSALIGSKLASIDIKIKDIRLPVSFDSEESCKKQNNGRWHERLK